MQVELPRYEADTGIHSRPSCEHGADPPASTEQTLLRARSRPACKAESVQVGGVWCPGCDKTDIAVWVGGRGSLLGIQLEKNVS